MDVSGDTTHHLSGRGRRVRRVAKWAGLAATLLVLGLAGASVRWTIALWWIEPRPGVSAVARAVQIGAGSVAFTSLRIGFVLNDADTNWLISPNDSPFTWTFSTYSDAAQAQVIVPLWFLLVLVGAPTAVLWYVDRRAIARRRAGHCPSCGYDLRGLPATAGTIRCPECGRAAAPTA